MMLCGRKEEDEEVRARWRMCVGAATLYNGSTPDPLPSRDFGKPRLTGRIPSRNHHTLMGYQMNKVGHGVKSH